MEDLVARPAELRARGFRALVESLGWVNAVRFLHQYETGTGNYTNERDAILPDWDAAALVENAKRA